MSELVKDIKSLDEFSELVTNKNGNTGLVLVDFWAPWCAPCRQLAPHVEAVAQELSDKLKVYKVNVDDDKIISDSYNVRNIPTILLFKNGVLVDRRVGALPTNDTKELSTWVQNHLN